MQVYVVGQHKGGKWPNAIWELYGIFEEEDDAVTACKDETYFVGPVELNKTLDTEMPVKWPGLHYPSYISP